MLLGDAPVCAESGASQERTVDALVSNKNELFAMHKKQR